MLGELTYEETKQTNIEARVSRLEILQLLSIALLGGALIWLTLGGKPKDFDIFEDDDDDDIMNYR